MPRVQIGMDSVEVQAKPKHWRFTAEQFQTMIAAGIFHKEDRAELLDGEIYEMASVGPWHGGSVDAVTMAFAPVLSGRAIVRVQGSFQLSEYSEPEPDILVLRLRSNFYRSSLPVPEDVLLLIEVSDSSVRYDRSVKLPLYAAGSVSEVWIVNRIDDCVEVYRQPRGQAYEDIQMRRRGETVSPLAFPEVSVAVDDLLG